MAGRDIDDVLRLHRWRLEKNVALARLIALGCAAVMTVAVQLLRPPEQVTWIPAMVFSGATVWALALLVYVRRRETGIGLALAAITGDMLIVTGVYPIVSNPEYNATLRNLSHDPAAAAQQSLPWIAFVCATSVLLVILVNSLRASRLASVYASVVGAALFVASVSLVPDLHWLEREWTPAVFIAASLILVSGWVGWYSASEFREFLERYARYELLKRWLPAEAVRRVLVDDRPIALGGRKLVLTLVATDLRGFTALSEGLAPEQLLEQLNEYHGAMLECVEARGGMLDKFIGDGSLSVFGHAHGEDAPADAGARAAVVCARDMLAALDALNARRATSQLAPLRMGIGIHTGEVVLGNIGAPGRRLELTVIGDAANTAARLESATKELGVAVVVSASTLERLPPGDASGLRALGEVTVRGRKELVAVHTLA